MVCGLIQQQDVSLRTAGNRSMMQGLLHVWQYKQYNHAELPKHWSDLQQGHAKHEQVICKCNASLSPSRPSNKAQ
jgi:hypothetical protein